MARLRTFIAVELEKGLRSRLVALQQALGRAGGDVKWVEPDNLHFTLLFLGEVDEREVPEVCQAVGDACAAVPAFLLSLQGIGCFPHPRRPRVIWVGAGTGAAEMVALHDVLEGPLLALGCYRREERQYTPHITLGRVKTDRPLTGLTAAIEKQAGWHGGECEVSEVRVMSSQLTPQGPIYSILSTAALGEPTVADAD